MAGKADRCRSMLAVCTRVGKCIQIDRTDSSILHRTEADRYFHLMARCGCCLGLFSRKDHFRRFSGFPGYKRRENFGNHRLLRSESAADSRLGNTDLRFRNAECIGQNAARMVNDLGRAQHIQPSVGIHKAVCPERLHHRLLGCAYMIRMLYDLIALCEHGFHISVVIFRTCTEISLIVRTDRTERFPAFLRMHQQFIILGLMKIQNGRKHFVLYFQELPRTVHAFFIFSGNNRHRISHVAHMLIEDQTVIRAWFRVGLSCHCKTLFRHILPGINRLNARNTLCCRLFHGFYDCIGMRTPQYLDNQTILRHQIIYIN